MNVYWLKIMFATSMATVTKNNTPSARAKDRSFLISEVKVFSPEA